MSWQAASDGLPGFRGSPYDVLLLAIDPTTPTTLYAKSALRYVGAGDSVFKSTDGAGTWEAFN